MRVLIIEDDQRLTRLMVQVLTEEHWIVDTAHDGDLGFELARTGAQDVIVVDWMLPGRDGPSICRALRADGIATPLLLLTARSQVEERVIGLDSGADDYLVKPFAFDELLARLRALSRRVSAAVVADGAELRAGDVVMDLRAHIARCGDQALTLTNTEWNLLECLLRNAGQALTRDQILDYVWSYDREVQPSLVDVYISYLRRKLHRAGHADPIQTVRGRGYRLTAPEARSC
jgi:two-component system, OmpR family, response regulator